MHESGCDNNWRPRGPYLIGVRHQKSTCPFSSKSSYLCYDEIAQTERTCSSKTESTIPRRNCRRHSLSVVRPEPFQQLRQRIKVSAWDFSESSLVYNQITIRQQDCLHRVRVQALRSCRARHRNKILFLGHTATFLPRGGSPGSLTTADINAVLQSVL